jgi:hypothetical protein
MRKMSPEEFQSYAWVYRIWRSHASANYNALLSFSKKNRYHFYFLLYASPSLRNKLTSLL